MYREYAVPPGFLSDRAAGYARKAFSIPSKPSQILRDGLGIARGFCGRRVEAATETLRRLDDVASDPLNAKAYASANLVPDAGRQILYLGLGARLLVVPHGNLGLKGDDALLWGRFGWRPRRRSLGRGRGRLCCVGLGGGSLLFRTCKHSIRIINNVFHTRQPA